MMVGTGVGLTADLLLKQLSAASPEKAGGRPEGGKRDRGEAVYL